MPKRAKTPPPPQDEYFMTVYYPYPQHANMEVDEDVQHVAQWLGSIVRPEYFNAFYHKPSARNTIIIEVSKRIGEDKRKLLGLHTWKDILKNPTEGEKDHKSGIFYCIFNNIRDVQKEGWKRIDFEDTWFMQKPDKGQKYKSIYYDQDEWDGIVREKGIFNIPYPLSKRCEVPMEDPTNRGFCRPLPINLFPIPVLPEMPREVPGTLEWIKVKAVPESAWAKTSPKTKGDSGSQGTQQKDQRGRTAVARNNHVGRPVAPANNGINHKPSGTLPPDLIVGDKGKGKQKDTGEPSTAADELMAHTLAMELGGVEEDPEYQEYYGAGLGDVLASVGVAAAPTSLPPDYDPIDHNTVGVLVDGVTVKNFDVEVEDSLWGDPLEKINKKLQGDDDVPLCDFHGKICSRGICKIYEKQKQLHDQQKKQKEKESREPQNWRNGNGSQNNGRGGPRARGGGRGRAIPLLRGSAPGKDFGPRSPADENRAPRRYDGITPPRNTSSRPNNNHKVSGAWGKNNNNRSAEEDKGGDDRPQNPPAGQDWSQSELGGGPQNPPAGQDWSQSELGGDSQDDPWSGRPQNPPAGRDRSQNELGGGSQGPQNPPAGQDWSKSELGGDSQDDPWSGRPQNPPVGRDRSQSKRGSQGPQNPPAGQDWSQSELGGGSQADPWSGRPHNPPGGQDWSQSELGGGSQGDPWSGPGKAKGGPSGTKNKSGATGGKNPAKPSWGDDDGFEDSVSQRGDEGFRKAPSRTPGKKSWADQVEDGDEMEYADGNEPAPVVVPEPIPEAGEGDDSWMESGKSKKKGKGRGKGSGKAKSTTGWSDVTNQGPW